jgi:hypothetical protein
MKKKERRKGAAGGQYSGVETVVLHSSSIDVLEYQSTGIME